mgnify:CR=1 FL=1
MTRYYSLDGLRGIAAVCVALMHFPILNHVTNLEFLKNSYLFVDLFFVISGFVIAGNIITQINFKDFILRRLKRLLPIYYITLFMSFCLECLLLLVPRLSQREAFTEVTSWSALSSELFLLHAFPFVQNSSFNPPSWSISTEVFLYIIIGLGFFYVRSSFIILTSALLAFFYGNFMIYSEYWNNAHELALYRGLAGFSAGYLVYQITHLETGFKIIPYAYFVDFWFVILVAFIYVDGTQNIFDKSLVFPSLMFGVFLLLLTTSSSRSFSHMILTHKITVWLGAISYPLYLLHYFIGHRIEDLCNFFSTEECFKNGNLLLVVYLCLCLITAYFLMIIANTISNGRRSYAT